MEMSAEEVNTVIASLEWYLSHHPRCPASKYALANLSSAIEKLKNIYFQNRVTQLLENIPTRKGENHVSAYPKIR